VNEAGISECLAHKEYMIAAYLFGSYVTGKATRRSDVYIEEGVAPLSSP
jgi:predicted nucleotidyltransferase